MMPRMTYSRFSFVAFFLIVLLNKMAISSIDATSQYLTPPHSFKEESTEEVFKATGRNFEKAGSRQLRSSVLTTTRCNKIRHEKYEAELRLVYSYLVEFSSVGGSRDIIEGVEMAITHAVAHELNSCDAFDRPKYQVKTNSNHQPSKDKFCAPLITGNICQVLTGSTYILLDSDSSDVQEHAYDAIEAGLDKSDFLDIFASNVVRAEFVERIGESLVLSPDGFNHGKSRRPGSVTATVAVAAASVSFLVSSIFCYGLMRKANQNHPEPRIRHKNRLSRRNNVMALEDAKSNNRVISSNSTNTRLIGIQKKRKRHFVRLVEFDPDHPTDFVTGTTFDSPKEGTATYTWSVSDLTSDSTSIRSTLSRTTSRLERIDEEEERDEENTNEDEQCEGGGDSSYHVSTQCRDSNIVAEFSYESPHQSSIRSAFNQFDEGEEAMKRWLDQPPSKGTHLHVEQFDVDKVLKDSENDLMDTHEQFDVEKMHDSGLDESNSSVTSIRYVKEVDVEDDEVLIIESENEHEEETNYKEVEQLKRWRDIHTS